MNSVRQYISRHRQGRLAAPRTAAPTRRRPNLLRAHRNQRRLPAIPRRQRTRAVPSRGSRHGHPNAEDATTSNWPSPESSEPTGGAGLRFCPTPLGRRYKPGPARIANKQAEAPATALGHCWRSDPSCLSLPFRPSIITGGPAAQGPAAYGSRVSPCSLRSRSKPAPNPCCSPGPDAGS